MSRLPETMHTPVGETSRSRFLPVGEPSRSLLQEGIGPTSVVRVRLHPNGSGAGAPELQNQRGDRTMARETRSDARVASEGPRPTVRGGVFFPHRGEPVTATLSDL